MDRVRKLRRLRARRREPLRQAALSRVYCDGGYSDHITVPHPKYLIELDGLDPVNAAPYACSGVTTYGALRKLSDVYPAEPIVVIGAGALA